MRRAMEWVKPSLENWLRVWWSLTLFFGYVSLILVGSGLELSY